MYTWCVIVSDRHTQLTHGLGGRAECTVVDWGPTADILSPQSKHIMGGDGSGQRIRNKTRKQACEFYQHGVRGHGLKATGAKFGIDPMTVRSIVIQFSQTGDISTSSMKSGRPRKLRNDDVQKMLLAIEANPYVTAGQLSALIDYKITARSVCRYLASLEPPVVRVTPVKQEPKERTEEWKDEFRDFVNQVKRIPFKDRVYADESAIYGNTAPKLGRARRGVKLLVSQPRYAKKYTLHVFADHNSVLFWDLADKNADDEEIKRVFLGGAVHKMKARQTLIWDRLGRSGRAKNPKTQHYNPEVKKKLESKGMSLLFLPPLGKYADPMELLFNDLKNHYLAPMYDAKGTSIPKAKLSDAIANYMEVQAPKKMAAFWKHRANAAEAFQLQII
jgi:transposase